jgi:hypothetical protein
LSCNRLDFGRIVRSADAYESNPHGVDAPIALVGIVQAGGRHGKSVRSIAPGF